MSPPSRSREYDASPPKPVTPSVAASVTAQATWSARVRGRRGRSQATRATSDGSPVPVAGTSPGGSSARTFSAIRRLSTWVTAASSGASAFHVFPAESFDPTSAGIRGLSSQARTMTAQRSATGWAVHRS